MRRRDLIGGVTAAALQPRAGWSESSGKVWRIACLHGGPEAAGLLRFKVFTDRMAKLGYVDGTNAIFDMRFAAGHFEHLPVLARELIGLSPDLMLASTTPAAIAAKAETKTLPIVIAAVADPLGAGLVQSLARPGANVTGVTNIVAELGGKRLEILREIVPTARRIAVMINPSDPNAPLQMRYATIGAQELALELRPVAEVRSADDVEPAFAMARRDGAQAAIRMVDPLVLALAKQTAAAEIKYRLPVIHAFRQNVMAGSLVSYGTDLLRQFSQAADLAAKILKGAKPADLPVEQPTRFELVINLKTARALGLNVPQSLLARADEVVE